MPDHMLHQYEVLHNRLSELEVLPVGYNPVEIMVTLICTSVTIYFGNWIKTVLPINLLFLLLLVQAAYVGVRWDIKGWREARGYI